MVCSKFQADLVLAISLVDIRAETPPYFDSQILLQRHPAVPVQ
jgi:hypothetical protein